MTNPSDELSDLLVRARALLARHDNDFSQAGWDDQSTALEELDAMIDEVRQQRAPKLALDVLFSPAGPIYEVSVTGGWSPDLALLAERYDRAVAQAVGPSWRLW